MPVITYPSERKNGSGRSTTCGESARAHLNGNMKAFDFCLNDSKATDNSGEDKRLSQGL